jgi:DNA-binding NarL/FixJ family response regulator
VRVGLADDSQLFRDGLASLLQASGIEVVLRAGTGRELAEHADAGSLDVAVLDVRMPPTFTEEGLDTADALRLHHPTVAVLVLSTYAETAYASRLFRRGAAGRGYLLKDAVNDPQALRVALERLNSGGTVLDGSIVDRLMAGTRRREPLQALTDTQRTVLSMIAQGDEDDEIGRTLGLSAAATQVAVTSTLGILGIRREPGRERVVSVMSWLRAETPLVTILPPMQGRNRD